MARDPIVDEVRQAREALLKTAGGTLGHLFDYLERQQQAAGRTAIVLPPKRPDGQSEPRPA